MLRLINFVIFQAGWFICVLAGARSDYKIPSAVAAVAILFNLIFRKPRFAEIKFILFAICLGLAFEYSISRFQILEYRDSSFFAPPWILCLWALFATTFSFSMNWMINFWWVGFILGFFSGPFSYWGAETLGALSLSEDFWPKGFIILGAHWAFAMSSLVMAYRVFHKIGRERAHKTTEIVAE